MVRGRSGVNHPLPPMFTPISVRKPHLKNRVICSPMATYMAQDGLPNDFHLVHLAARAMGGAAMVVAEMTCVSPMRGLRRAAPACGMTRQMNAWKRVVDFVHTHTDAKIAFQLGMPDAKAPPDRDGTPLISPFKPAIGL